MINLAVINIKDVIKYLVRITIIITIVLVLTRYFLKMKSKIEVSSNISQNTWLSCMNTVIPSLKVVNNTKSNNITEEKKQKPLYMALELELGMANYIQKISVAESKEEKQEENTENIETTQTTQQDNLEEAKTGLKTEVQESSVPQKFTSTYGTVKIKNETKKKLTEEILKPDIKLSLDNILIYHTHSCESYTPSEKYNYKKTGNFRTTDKSYSVIRVGTELTNYMQKYGHKIVHDTNLYDYPSYNGAYDRSLAAASKILEKNKDIEVMFDVHRDAIRR